MMTPLAAFGPIAGVLVAAVGPISVVPIAAVAVAAVAAVGVAIAAAVAANSHSHRRVGSKAAFIGSWPNLVNVRRARRFHLGR
jgi:hypothetical protein